MPKPMCVKCQRFYRPDKNGVYVLEQMPDGNDTPSGTTSVERWHPYKIWSADRWKCPGCGHLLVSGWGARPCSEHYEQDFPKYLEQVSETVNDC